MKNSKKVSDIPPMNDEKLAKFWDNNEPEDFEGVEGRNNEIHTPT